MIAATAIMLTACGGGAGGTPTVTYTATSVCASGPALTSTVSQAAANARVPADCPAVSTVGVGVSIAGNMLSITGLPAGVSVASSTVTMVSGASTVVFVNGAITSGILLSNATYTYTGGQVKFTNAPAIIIAGTFVTQVNPSAAACSLTTQTFATGLNACAINQGIGQKLDGLTEIPGANTKLSDVQNLVGTNIKVFSIPNKLRLETNETDVPAGAMSFLQAGDLAFADRPAADLVVLVYKSEGFDRFMPLYKDTGTLYDTNNFLTTALGSSLPVTWVKVYPTVAEPTRFGMYAKLADGTCAKIWYQHASRSWLFGSYSCPADL